MALARNRNMPLFQVKRPVAKKLGVAIGFSTKRAIGVG